MYPRVHAEGTPDARAVVFDDIEVDYAELDARSTQLARLCRSRGLQPGDQMAIWSQNHPRYYEVYWAAMRAGLYVTGINRHATPAEAAYLLEDSGARLLIGSAEMADRARAVLPLIPGCPHRLMLDGTVDGYESYEKAIAQQSTAPLVDEPRGEVMLYSAGTTGRPKGIRRALTGRRVDDPTVSRPSVLGTALLGIGADTVYLMPAPLYHAAALLWSAGVQEVGGTVVVMKRFDAEDMLRLIERHRVTHVQVVPTMMIRLLKLPAEVRGRYDLSSLRSFVHAAAPCPAEVKYRMIDWLGPVVHEYYAATEGNGVTFASTEDWLRHPGTVGRPVLGIAHICDDTGAELPPHTPGTIYFERERTPFVYHHDDDQTRDALHPRHDNWSTTGDVGYLDDDGFLYLTDRKAFTIISGGVNIYPAEIESCLVVHPRVSDVVVFGLPDPEMGEFVQAVVVPADPEAGDELVEELLAYARERLSGDKIPRRIDLRSSIPRLETGKVRKSEIRAGYLPDPEDRA